MPAIRSACLASPVAKGIDKSPHQVIDLTSGSPKSTQSTPSSHRRSTAPYESRHTSALAPLSPSKGGNRHSQSAQHKPKGAKRGSSTAIGNLQGTAVLSSQHLSQSPKRKRSASRPSATLVRPENKRQPLVIELDDSESECDNDTVSPPILKRAVKRVRHEKAVCGDSESPVVGETSDSRVFGASPGPYSITERPSVNGTQESPLPDALSAPDDDLASEAAADVVAPQIASTAVDSGYASDRPYIITDGHDYSFLDIQPILQTYPRIDGQYGGDFLVLANNPGGGFCGFAAIAFCLFGSTRYAPYIRTQALAQLHAGDLDEHWQDLSNMTVTTDGITLLEIDQDVNEFASEMLRMEETLQAAPGEMDNLRYGFKADMRVEAMGLIARALNLHLLIFQPPTTQQGVQLLYNIRAGPGARQVYLELDMVNHHYRALVSATAVHPAAATVENVSDAEDSADIFGIPGAIMNDSDSGSDDEYEQDDDFVCDEVPSSNGRTYDVTGVDTAGNEKCSCPTGMPTAESLISALDKTVAQCSTLPESMPEDWKRSFASHLRQLPEACKGWSGSSTSESKAQEDEDTFIKAELAKIIEKRQLDPATMHRFKSYTGSWHAPTGLHLFYPPIYTPSTNTHILQGGSWTMNKFLGAGVTEQTFVTDSFPFSSPIPYGSSQPAIGDSRFTWDSTLTPAATEDIWSLLKHRVYRVHLARLRHPGIEVVLGAQAREVYDAAARTLTDGWLRHRMMVPLTIPAVTSSAGQHPEQFITVPIDIFYCAKEGSMQWGKMVWQHVHPSSHSRGIGRGSPVSFANAGLSDALTELLIRFSAVNPVKVPWSSTFAWEARPSTFKRAPHYHPPFLTAMLTRERLRGTSYTRDELEALAPGLLAQLARRMPLPTDLGKSVLESCVKWRARKAAITKKTTMSKVVPNLTIAQAGMLQPSKDDPNMSVAQAMARRKATTMSKDYEGKTVEEVAVMRRVANFAAKRTTMSKEFPLLTEAQVKQARRSALVKDSVDWNDDRLKPWLEKTRGQKPHVVAAATAQVVRAKFDIDTHGLTTRLHGLPTELANTDMKKWSLTDMAYLVLGVESGRITPDYSKSGRTGKTAATAKRRVTMSKEYPLLTEAQLRVINLCHKGNPRRPLVKDPVDWNDARLKPWLKQAQECETFRKLCTATAATIASHLRVTAYLLMSKMNGLPAELKGTTMEKQWTFVDLAFVVLGVVSGRITRKSNVVPLQSSSGNASSDEESDDDGSADV